MIRFLLVALTAVFLFVSGAKAEEAGRTVRFFEDQPYQKLNENDSHPMDDMLRMAEKGDTRAQFILGDLYSKGQGGLPKNLKTARSYFERSARHGENFSFIRLAALAKRDKKYQEAYMWYTLAADRMSYGPVRKHALAARDALAKETALPQADIRAAKSAADDWKIEAGRLLREEKSAERKQAEKKDQAGEKSADTEKSGAGAGKEKQEQQTRAGEKKTVAETQKKEKSHEQN